MDKLRQISELYKAGMISQGNCAELMVDELNKQTFASKVPSQAQQLDKLAEQVLTQKKLKEIEGQILALEAEKKFIESSSPNVVDIDWIKSKWQEEKILLKKEYNKFKSEYLDESYKEQDYNGTVAEKKKMANPNIEEMNAVTQKVLQPLLDKFLFSKSPFVSYLENKLENKDLELVVHNDGTLPITELTKPKPKKLTKLEQAIKELEGMGFETLSCMESPPTSSADYWEIRMETFSPTFGKIIKIEKAGGDGVFQDARDKAILWIWKEAKRRLLEGKVIQQPSLKNPSGYMIGVDTGKF